MRGSSVKQPIVIVGAGLVGSLLAVFLRRRGLPVSVWERRDDPRAEIDDAGRSINLVVSSRGVLALRQVGLQQAVDRLSVPVTGRMMHDHAGALTYQPYGRDDSECNYSISRGELNRFLIDQAECAGARFQFGARLESADLARRRLTFVDGADRRTESDFGQLVGADGAGSAVREALRSEEGFSEDVALLDHGYKELKIPAAAGGAYPIEKHALHIWPRGERMLMALANLDGSFTVTLYLPMEGEDSFATLRVAADVRRFFEREFPDAIPLIPDLEQSFFANPTGTLGTVRCHPWHLGDRVLLVGDAAHAIVPFFGQGMNAGFEDCTELDRLLDELGHDAWGELFARFSEMRKPHTDAIAEMALENFVEMRDRVGDEAFLLRKAVEHRLEEACPTEYRSRYSLVMYGGVPYRTAQKAGVIQQQILDELCGELSRAEDLDLARARALIRERLAPFLRLTRVSLEY